MVGHSVSTVPFPVAPYGAGQSLSWGYGMTSYEERCHEAARLQMPGVPVALLDSLPIDGAGLHLTQTGGSPLYDGLYLAQTGGFTMCLAYGDRLMSEYGTDEDGDRYLVTSEPNGGEYGVTLYCGNDVDAALAALTGGTA